MAENNGSSVSLPSEFNVHSLKFGGTTGSLISLPSFRNGIEFNVHPLNFGGTKAMMKSTKGDDIDVMEVMLYETLKREFPNVLSDEVNKLEQDDYIKLMKYVTVANGGLERLDKKDDNETDEVQGVEESPESTEIIP